MRNVPRAFVWTLFTTALVMPSPVNAQFGGIQNFFRGLQSSTSCSQMKQWVSSVPNAAGSQRQEDLLPLLDDSRFVKVFGKPYEQMTVGDFRDVQNGIRECQRTGSFTPGEAQAVQYLLNPSIHPTLSRQVVAARTQRAQYESLLAELDQLQPTDVDVRKLTSIQEQLNASMRSATPDERRAVAAKVDATRERIVGPLERERVSKRLAEAQGSDGLASLGNLYDELGKSALSAQEVESLKQQIARRMSELAAPVIQEERQTASTIGGGLTGLERGVQFLNSFEARYQRTARGLTELESVRREVLDQRAGMLPGLEPALIAEVRKASSAAQVNEVLSRYLTTSERQGSQRNVVAAAQERSVALQRKTENDRVFGSKSDTSSASTQATAAAAPSRTGRAFLSDPNELRKYNEGRLIKAIYDGNLSSLPSDKVFVRSYLLQHARVFADPCRIFTLADIREFEQIAMREQMPRSQAEVGQQMLQSLKAFAAMRDNPSRMVDAAAVEQKRQDAEQFADKDLEALVESYGACDSPIMKQYAKNVGSYLRNAGRGR
ncbi:MAG: hypothetical protein JWN13_6670 [Betaproteobacteria bacterium]|jgi:hypothetical protein|nr:hypothetical protein [Betaproteobacteria bacterium]MEA3158014.1 hypothetical protein [Betaproteobacteria bacterium]